jgi:hypothetical protein
VSRFVSRLGAWTTLNTHAPRRGVVGIPDEARASPRDPRDQTAALGSVGVMSDLPAKTTKGGTLYAFALP